MRSSVLTNAAALFANELTVIRDSFYSTHSGTRYEIDGSMPYAGKKLRVFAANESGESCILTQVVIWDSNDPNAERKAMKFIAVNAASATAVIKGDSSGNAATATSVTERLQELNRLRDGGLITDSEYQEKRRKILESL